MLANKVRELSFYVSLSAAIQTAAVMAGDSIEVSNG
jgi:hypothetical protein